MDSSASAAEERPTGLLAWTVFPVTLSAAVGVTIWLMGRGVDPALAFLAPLVGTYVVVVSLERITPFHRSWLKNYGDLQVDIGHLVVSGAIGLEMLRPLMLVVAVAAGGWLSAWLGSTLWPTDWNLVAQLILALVVGEFFMYWVHRWAHEWPILWRFHAVHHSAPRLYFLNAVRFHPVDLAISHFAPWIPLVMLGADARLLGLFTLVSAVHGMFQHANIPIRCGILNYFFSMAELHRWHHSPILEESNTNYGQNLIIWDLVFGTRFLPEDRLPPEKIGLAGIDDFPMGYWGQLKSPFVSSWWFDDHPGVAPAEEGS